MTGDKIFLDGHPHRVTDEVRVTVYPAGNKGPLESKNLTPFDYMAVTCTALFVHHEDQPAGRKSSAPFTKR